MPATIRFEQNLNHWYPPRPGFLDIALSHSTNPSEADFETLATLDDSPLHEMVTTTVFSVEVVMPAKPCAHCILRTRYVSHNPLEIDPKNNTDSIFYNCADIELLAVAPHADGSARSSPGLSRRPVHTQPPAGAGGYTCRTPDRFRAKLLETNAWGVVEHTLWWDSINQLTRWDKNGSLDSSGRASTLSLINDYTKPIEYVNFITRGQCHIYGNDKFNPWVYDANTSGLVRTRRTSSNVDVWNSLRGDAVWFTRDMGGGNCLPVGWRLGETSVDVVYSEAVSGPFAAGTFTPDPSCNKHPTFAGCRAEVAKTLWADGHRGTALLAARVDPPPPTAPLPYTTTMLRTHHFSSAEFLSIAEELSVRALSPSGPPGHEEAYYIFPAVPFSMRDANKTVVRGIRAVFRHTSDSAGSYKETWYFLTGTDGIERCVRHSLTNVTVATSRKLDPEILLRGGILTKAWVTESEGTGGSTTTYYVEEKRGDPEASGSGKWVSYPFRISVVHPPGGVEVGYVLDHGQHFPTVVDSWFAKDGCPPATTTTRAKAPSAPNPYMEISQILSLQGLETM